jgi:hypothetical protein
MMASGQKKEYRDSMQASGITEPGLSKGVPMKATPVSPIKHLLGGKPYPHPFIKGREKV